MLFGILILLFWLIGIFVEVFNFFWVEYRKSKGDIPPYNSGGMWASAGSDNYVNSILSMLAGTEPGQ